MDDDVTTVDERPYGGFDAVLGILAIAADFLGVFGESRRAQVIVSFMACAFLLYTGFRPTPSPFRIGLAVWAFLVGVLVIVSRVYGSCQVLSELALHETPLTFEAVATTLLACYLALFGLASIIWYKTADERTMGFFFLGAAVTLVALRTLFLGSFLSWSVFDLVSFLLSGHGFWWFALFAVEVIAFFGLAVYFLAEEDYPNGVLLILFGLLAVWLLVSDSLRSVFAGQYYDLAGLVTASCS